MRMLRWINGNTWKDKIIGYETFSDIWWSDVLVVSKSFKGFGC